LFKNHKTIFSIVDEPPSWSDVDDSLESLSEPDEEDDMPEDKDSSRSGAGDEEVNEHEEMHDQEDEEDSDGDFFDAGEGATVDDRVSSRAASKSGQSEGDTEDDPVMPMTPGPTVTNTADATTPQRKVHAVSFSRTTSADDGDLDDEEWVDPTPIPATPLDATPPTFPTTGGRGDTVPVPPMMAKAKSSGSTKSRKRKEARPFVPFPSSSQAEGTDERPRRVPQMSTARGRDGGRTQSGGVKGVIAPEPEAEPEPGPEPDPGPADPDDPDGDDF
jgi:cysteine protease ATG4